VAEEQRLDRFLWYARLAKTRSAAQAIARDGHLRIDRRAIDRAHALIRPGQVLSFPLHGRVRVLRVLTLPKRRGPPAEARALYEDLSPAVDAAPSPPLAGPSNREPDT
jgi:ribosome-associated heat shock protein Hsp15